MDVSNLENDMAKGFADELAALRKQVTENEARLGKSENRLRATWVVSCLVAFAMLTIGWHKDAIAQGYGMTLAQAATRIAALETKTQDMNRITDPNTNQPTVRFSAVNVQVVSGKDSTDATVNGTGNLLIGYNELRVGNGRVNTRTGSHNLIIGRNNNYGGFGGAVVGFYNETSGSECSVVGGAFGNASGTNTTVSGGSSGAASGIYSCVSGGFRGTANSNYASVFGGYQNEASADAACVFGGSDNLASGDYTTVTGGSINTASGLTASVVGGQYITQSNGLGFSAGGTYNYSSRGMGAFHSP